MQSGGRLSDDFVEESVWTLALSSMTVTLCLRKAKTSRGNMIDLQIGDGDGLQLLIIR